MMQGDNQEFQDSSSMSYLSEGEKFLYTKEVYCNITNYGTS